MFTRTIYAPSSYTPARSKSASRGVTSGSPVTSDTTYDETLCDSLFYAVELLEGAREWQQTYDSAEAFIETCYNSPNAPMMFGVFASAWEQIAGHDSAKMAQGQRWLESVLYLNTTNPEYFCACVEHFGIWWPDTGGETHAWRSENRTLAIDRWLIQNTSCDTPHIQGWYDASRESQRDDWLNDTNVLYDTTLPALDSIEPGLEELLDRHLLYASVADRPPNAPMIISDASASPNPVNTGTVISFAMNKEAYVKIQLYDVLGKQLGNSAFESLFQPGNKSVPISLAGLPSGTYYARIVTAYGEVQTVKLVKE